MDSYLLALTRERKPYDDESLSPVVRELRGIAAGGGLSEGDYKEHLWQKYMRDGK